MDAAIFLNEPFGPELHNPSSFFLRVDGSEAAMTFAPPLHSQECACVRGCLSSGKEPKKKKILSKAFVLTDSQDPRAGASVGGGGGGGAGQWQRRSVFPPA